MKLRYSDRSPDFPVQSHAVFPFLNKTVAVWMLMRYSEVTVADPFPISTGFP
jgi:hypothetical protein